MRTSWSRAASQGPKLQNPKHVSEVESVSLLSNKLEYKKHAITSLSLKRGKKRVMSVL
jgi:hypothetical protein